jgi:hypothetical protein
VFQYCVNFKFQALKITSESKHQQTPAPKDRVSMPERRQRDKFNNIFKHLPSFTATNIFKHLPSSTAPTFLHQRTCAEALKELFLDGIFDVGCAKCLGLPDTILVLSPCKRVPKSLWSLFGG